MNWFKNIFKREKAKPEAAALRPLLSSLPPIERYITTENILSWCARLEKEADRTGNARLRQQAQTIRTRLTS